MAWLILIGFLLFTTIVYVYLQKLVIKLPHKIWHFVPIIFLSVLTVYGYLRSNRVIVYYSDYDNDWTNGVIEFPFGANLSTESFDKNAVLISLSALSDIFNFTDSG